MLIANLSTKAVLRLASPVSESGLVPVTLGTEVLAPKWPGFIPLCEPNDTSSTEGSRQKETWITLVTPTHVVTIRFIGPCQEPDFWFPNVLIFGVNTLDGTSTVLCQFVNTIRCYITAPVVNLIVRFNKEAPINIRNSIRL